MSTRHKKTIGVCAIFLICITVLFSAGDKTGRYKASVSTPPIEWEQTYGSNWVDWGRCIQQTSDGGFIVTGAYDRNVYSPWQGYVYLLKTTFDGSVEWEKQYGIPLYDNIGYFVQQTWDGGYIIAGATGYTYHTDAYLIKTDSDGELTWSTILGTFEKPDDSLCVQQTLDGGYIVTGWTGSYGAGSSDAWLIKLNSAGREEWSRTFGGVDLDGGSCVKQTLDGGFIIAGQTFSFDTGGGGDAWLIKTDENGEEMWNRSYGGQYLEDAKCVLQTPDGGYILAGSTHSYGAGSDDVWLIRTDMYGNEIWNRTFGDSEWDQGKNVVQTSDGGFFVTGDYTDPIQGDLELYMIKTDSDGIQEWAHIVEHPSSKGVMDSGSYGIQTSDGGYIATGETGEYMLADVDLYLVKIEKENHPPEITSAPVKEASLNGLYTYDVDAMDPDPFDNLLYELVEFPDEMTIDAETGMIEWIPTLENTGTPALKPIVIISEVGGGEAGSSKGPMLPDPQTPSQSQARQYRIKIPVTVRVSDPWDGYDEQRWEIAVYP